MAIVDCNGTGHQPLLRDSVADGNCDVGDYEDEEKTSLSMRAWAETRKLWHIIGPALFGRMAQYTMNIVTQAFRVPWGG